MKKAFVARLSQIFFAIGVLSLVLCITQLLAKFLLVGERYKSLTGIGDGPFIFEQHLAATVNFIGETFFVFLISGVFQMIARGDVGAAPRTERYMQVTCGAYLFYGLLQLWKWLGSWKHFFLCSGLPDCDFTTKALNIFSGITWGLSIIVPPILFAISVYVLYRHFTGLVKFESEVA